MTAGASDFRAQKGGRGPIRVGAGNSSMVCPEGPEEAREGPARVAGLLMRYRTDLYAYLLAAVRNHHDAEDLLQEVSLAATRSWEQYQEGTNFRAWAREIARRRILDHAKRSERRAALLDPEVLQRLEAAAVEVEEAEPAELRREALRRCLESVRGLPRRVLDLRYEQRLEVPGIAAAIGRTVQGTYALLKRVRQSLRECADRRLSGALS